ncbi:MAG: carboxypeptidase-like regulatory domain-containing protein, partial [Bryobacteraceae bacterium]
MRFLPVLALCVSALWAQDTALLSGSVLDSSGAPVAKAEVRILSRTSSFDAKKTANQGGDFAFDLLEPGEYSLTVTHDGFQT